VGKNTRPLPVSIRVGYGCHPRVKNRPRTRTRRVSGTRTRIVIPTCLLWWLYKDGIWARSLSLHDYTQTETNVWANSVFSVLFSFISSSLGLIDHTNRHWDSSIPSLPFTHGLFAMMTLQGRYLSKEPILAWLYPNWDKCLSKIDFPCTILFHSLDAWSTCQTALGILVFSVHMQFVCHSGPVLTLDVPVWILRCYRIWVQTVRCYSIVKVNNNTIYSWRWQLWHVHHHLRPLALYPSCCLVACVPDLSG
jgi:hypothetical protein